MYMDLYTDIELEDRIVNLNKQLNKKIERLKKLRPMSNKFGPSVIQINEIVFDIYDEIKVYTSEQPKKIVFVKLKESLENLSLIYGFGPNDNNHTFNVYKQSILEKINEIINTHTERITPPTHTRSYSRRTPRTRSSAGGKNKTNKKR